MGRSQSSICYSLALARSPPVPSQLFQPRCPQIGMKKQPGRLDKRRMGKALRAHPTSVLSLSVPSYLVGAGVTVTGFDAAG